MHSDDTTQDYADEAEAMESISRIVSPHGPALLDIYFRVVHPSFPIIQKHVFMDRIRRGESKNIAPSLLAGMYLLALNWWNFDNSLVKHQRPDVARLDAIASKSLSQAMQRPKLSTVQAGLLLLQRPEADSWSLTTQLVAIGQELGLHLDCSDWEIPQWERSLRKRIAWALYMQDKWSSLIHGRPSHIFSANWAVKPITEDDNAFDNQVNPNIGSENENEKEEMEQGHVLFSHMIALTGIMAEVMDTFYTQTAIRDFAKAGSKSTEMILERAKPVQIKLKEWFTKMPPCVRMENVQKGRLAPAGFLHLAYFATEITLHRRIVQSLSNDTSKPYLLYICRSAAKTRLISAMDFVNRLRPEHLQAFWYFPSKINFTLIGTFGGLLLATAPAKEEADFYKTRLQEYRWTLSVSSNRAEFLDYAVQMLDTSRAMLRNLQEKPSLAASHISSVGVPDSSMAKPPGPESTQSMEDITMGEDTPPLTRTTSLSNASVSVFSGFSTDAALEQYSATSRDAGESPEAITPKSSA
ncbi:hypothetical protein BT63DRAFT_13239 [Microthyrium microscopicum]|uniref:Xylanolytic transcriptional activator regulatory domain-containing protein n=1 Tax=Microthyrium microscopicum TaxID=703497 RepID=A0A6A6UU07_9PEZI|nr:hypothetical protein BT63DRAFT_13239 [Microthyrium microscopicum]